MHPRVLSRSPIARAAWWVASLASDCLSLSLLTHTHTHTLADVIGHWLDCLIHFQKVKSGSYSVRIEWAFYNQTLMEYLLSQKYPSRKQKALTRQNAQRLSYITQCSVAQSCKSLSWNRMLIGQVRLSGHGRLITKKMLSEQRDISRWRRLAWPCK